MADHLQCGVCHEPYNNKTRMPKFLKCGSAIQHTFCLECLRRLTVGEMIRCPICSDLTSVTGSAAALATNIYLMPQIEAAASARQSQGLQLFCKTCSKMATEHCGEHDLLRPSEAKDLLLEKARTLAEDLEAVKHQRSIPLQLYITTLSVLRAAIQQLKCTIEEYGMDIQMDDDIILDLERKREAIMALPNEEVSEKYAEIGTTSEHTQAALKDVTAVAKQCEALKKTNVKCTLLEDLQLSFPVGEWLNGGNLKKALLAASAVVYCLDPTISDEDIQPTCKSTTQTNGKPTPKSFPNGTAVANGHLSSVSNGAIPKTSASPNGKAATVTNGSNGNAKKVSSNGTKTTATLNGASNAKPITTTKLANGTAAGKTLVFTATNSTASATANGKKPPSFSNVVKKTAAGAEEPAARGVTAQRPLRGVHPLYCLEMSNGNNKANVIIELRTDMAPVMCRNFVLLCEGKHFDNTNFQYAKFDIYLLGGKLGKDSEGFSPLAEPPAKYVTADVCPLKDECGAVRMKGMESIKVDGYQRGLVGSQFMIWVSETYQYTDYAHTLVFGHVRQGLDFVRLITQLDRPAIWRNAKLVSARRYEQ